MMLGCPDGSRKWWPTAIALWAWWAIVLLAYLLWLVAYIPVGVAWITMQYCFELWTQRRKQS